MGRLDEVDLSLALSRREEEQQLSDAWKRLTQLRLTLGGLIGRQGTSLWRFWPALPGWGGMAVFDRSWYGRVLVERVDGLASREAWMRAYDEVNGCERSLADEGMIIVKFWLHLSADEQLKRFEQRAADPLKVWKLTDEDWANRSKRGEYEQAVEEMVARTDQPWAPRHLIAAESKRYARVAVLRTVNEAIEAGMRSWGQELPPAP